MTERDTIHLLRAIKDLALLGDTPTPTIPPSIDCRLLLCLGQIAMMVSKTLTEMRQQAAQEEGG